MSADLKPPQASPESAHEAADALTAVVDSAPLGCRCVAVGRFAGEAICLSGARWRRSLSWSNTCRAPVGH